MGHKSSQVRHLELGDLIRNAKAAEVMDDPSMTEIIRRFEPLVTKLARAMTLDAHLREDLANAGRLAITKAVTNHTSEIVTFPAYLRMYVKGAMRRELRMWLLPIDVSHWSELDDGTGADLLFVLNERAGQVADRTWGDLTPALAALKPGQQHILALHFIDDLSVARTASEVDSTASAVSHRLMTIYSVLAQRLAA